MEPTSASTCRGLVPWQGLLLAASLLTFWNVPTTAQLTIVSTNAAERTDVLLRVRNLPDNILSYVWYKGERVGKNHLISLYNMGTRKNYPGSVYSGRETINLDGSLLFKNITLEDTGHYTIVVILRNFKKEIGFGQLRVYQLVRMPTLLVSKTTAIEHKDAVVLTCYTNGISIQWFFNYMNLRLTKRMKLSKNNSTLTIDPISRKDAGDYFCEGSNPISYSESEPCRLDVTYE